MCCWVWWPCKIIHTSGRWEQSWESLIVVQVSSVPGIWQDSGCQNCSCSVRFINSNCSCYTSIVFMAVVWTVLRWQIHTLHKWASIAVYVVTAFEGGFTMVSQQAARLIALRNTILYPPPVSIMVLRSQNEMWHRTNDSSEDLTPSSHFDGNFP